MWGIFFLKVSSTWYVSCSPNQQYIPNCTLIQHNISITCNNSPARPQVWNMDTLVSSITTDFLPVCICFYTCWHFWYFTRTSAAEITPKHSVPMMMRKWPSTAVFRVSSMARMKLEHNSNTQDTNSYRNVLQLSSFCKLRYTVQLSLRLKTTYCGGKSRHKVELNGQLQAPTALPATK